MYFHQPVLVKEVLEYLNLKSNSNVIDGTIGGGGHAEAILEKIGPNGYLLGFDRDSRAIQAAGEHLARFASRVILIKDSYQNINKNINEYRLRFPFGFNAVLLDLGLSSAQVSAEDARGFSFKADQPLDMRFGSEFSLTAEEIVNQWRVEDLLRIFKEYGEERYTKLIAQKIITARKVKEIKTTGELVEIIDEVYRHKQGRINPVTKIFQALRIAVNDELNVLKSALPQVLEVLGPGGRLAVISYHSLEDRLVKQFFQKEAKNCLCPKEIPVCCCGHQASLKIITKKPIIPSDQEIQANPRSRSAKLRVAEKI